jgi:hypothetical protein
MSRHLAAPRILVALLTPMALAACATESPVAPEPSTAASGSLSARAEVPPGVYALAFHASGDLTYQEISTLPVLSRELILKAYVVDSAGRPAGKGTVTFEYCSYKGGTSERHHARRRSAERGMRAGLSFLGAPDLHVDQ